MKKLLALAITVTALGGTFTAYTFSQSKVAVATEVVTIYRDDYGVPHIYADTH